MPEIPHQPQVWVLCKEKCNKGMPSHLLGCLELQVQWHINKIMNLCTAHLIVLEGETDVKMNIEITINRYSGKKRYVNPL